MFVALDEVFEYDGMQLTAGKVPRHFWPCQNCALYGKCCEDFGKESFPECMAEQRRDSRDVVFFEYFPPTIKGTPRRRRE